MAKQKKSTTEEPPQEEINFMHQITLNHATTVAVYLDYCETMTKIEGVKPDDIRKRVNKKIEELLPPSSPFKKKS